MRTVLTNLGSRGDVQPLFALAHALRRKGHRPLLLVAPQFRDDVEHLDFEFSPLGLDLDYRYLQQRDTNSELSGEDPLVMMKRSLELMESMLPIMFEQTLQACRKSDVLVGGHLQPVARMIHELTEVPFVSIHTNHFGGLQPKPFRDAACSAINPFRLQHGLRTLSDPLHTDAHSPQLALHIVSRHLRAQTWNLPSHHHITGFFFHDDDGWIPEEPLLEFLGSGESPIVISFSSMTHSNPAAMTALLVEAIQRVGCRAVIQSGWSGLGQSAALPENVYVAGFVPHTWLFSQASCIVHAGGAGTTAAALRSGVPSVIVPHLIDQPLWAELVHGLGCTSSIIHLRDLTADLLTRALKDTLGDAQVGDAARQVARKIRAERGVDLACSLIDKVLHELGVLV